MSDPTQLTRADLEAKLTKLREQLVQLRANCYAFEGAVQVLEQLLSEHPEPKAD